MSQGATGTLGVFFCGPHVISSQIEAAALKNMHDQAIQQGADGERHLNDFVRVVFRKENF